MSNVIPLPAGVTSVTGIDPVAVIDRTTTYLNDVLEQIDTIDGATDEAALKVAKSACDAVARAQTGVLMIRTRAERELGRVIREGQHENHVLRRNGISRVRGQVAGQLSLIPQEYIDGYLTEQMGNAERDITMDNVKALLPRATRDQPKAAVPEVAAPSIDVEIAREYGIDVADARAELIAGSISDTLAEFKPKMRYIYMLHHGITEDGTLEGESWSLNQIANAMNVTRESIRPVYFEAKAEVMAKLAADALAAVPH